MKNIIIEGITFKLHNLDRNVNELVSPRMGAVCSLYFAGTYWFLFAPSNLHLLFFISETLIFQLFLSSLNVPYQEVFHSEDWEFI